MTLWLQAYLKKNKIQVIPNTVSTTTLLNTLNRAVTCRSVITVSTDRAEKSAPLLICSLNFLTSVWHLQLAASISSPAGRHTEQSRICILIKSVVVNRDNSSSTNRAQISFRVSLQFVLLEIWLLDLLQVKQLHTWSHNWQVNCSRCSWSLSKWCVYTGLL